MEITKANKIYNKLRKGKAYLVIDTKKLADFLPTVNSINEMAELLNVSWGVAKKIVNGEPAPMQMRIINKIVANGDVRYEDIFAAVTDEKPTVIIQDKGYAEGYAAGVKAERNRFYKLFQKMLTELEGDAE